MHAKDLLHEDTEAPAMNCSGKEKPPVCLKCGWQGTVEEHDLSSTQHGGKPLSKQKRIYLDFLQIHKLKFGWNKNINTSL